MRGSRAPFQLSRSVRSQSIAEAAVSYFHFEQACLVTHRHEPVLPMPAEDGSVVCVNKDPSVSLFSVVLL